MIIGLTGTEAHQALANHINSVNTATEILEDDKLKELVDRIQDEDCVLRYTKDQMIHTKLYVFTSSISDEYRAYVGSMNLSDQALRQNREMLERLAYFYVGSREEAQDIVSQSFMKLWEKRDELVQDRLLSYLFTTVKNACLDYRKEADIHRQVHEQIARQERAMMDIYTATIASRDPVALFSDEILSIYKDTLLSLEPEQREVWLRSRIEGLSYKEIADMLGISYKRVDKNMQKVAKKLKEALSEYLSLILLLSSQGLNL